MRRGEVWWANLPAPVGRRPVLLLSRDRAYLVRQLITVAQVTTRIRNVPTEVRLGPPDGLPRECVANLDVIDTIPKRLLLSRISMLHPSQLEAVEAAIRFALGMVR